MKQKTYGILITILSIILLAVLGIRLLLPLLSGGPQAALPAAGEVYRNGDFTGYYRLTEDLPASTAQEAEETARALGLAGDGELEETCEVRSGSFTIYRFAQTYEGLPVYGREAAVMAGEDGMAVTASGNSAKIGTPSTSPSLTEAQAQEAALAYGRELWDTEEIAFSLGTGTPLVIFPAGDGEGLLAYLGLLTGPEPGELLIDAQNGDILSYTCIQAAAGELTEYETVTYSPAILDYEGHGTSLDYSCNIQYSPQGNQFHFTCSEKNIILLQNVRQKDLTWVDYNMGRLLAEALTDQEIQLAHSGEWPAEREGLKAYLYANMAYDFFLDVLDRHGYDGNNSPLYLVYNCSSYDGIFNDGAWSQISGRGQDIAMARLSFGYKNENTANVVSHEYTHAVTMSICGNYGEVAVMECFSDMFGELIEAYYADEDPDWKVSSTSRVLEKPEAPDLSINQKYSYYEYSVVDDAYSNSTVASYAMVLTWQDWRDREGLSVQECVRDMALLLYRSMFLLENDSSLEDFAYAAATMASIMTLSGELTDAQAQDVAEAFSAVDLPASSGPLHLSAPELTSEYQFRVLDFSTGEPIEGAQVHFWLEEDGMQLDHRYAVTDAEGFCVLPGLRSLPEARISVTAGYYEEYSGTMDGLRDSSGSAVNEIRLTPVSHDSRPVLEKTLKELTLRYGVIPNEPSIYESLNSNPYYGGSQTLVPGERLDGLLFADFYDYDGDGEEELLTVRAESGEYEVSGDSSSNPSLTFYAAVYDEFKDLNPYAEDPGYELRKTEDLTFRFPGFADKTPYSSVHFARGEVQGQTCLYVDFLYDFNSQSFGTLQISYAPYDGRLLLSHGAECSEFAYAAVCDTVSSEEALSSLGGRNLGTGRSGWSAGREYNWEGNYGREPTAQMMDGYRQDYENAMAGLGLADSNIRSFHLAEHGGTEGSYDRCARRPSEHLVTLEGEPLTDLGGIVSPGTIFTDTETYTWHMELTSYDSCGYLDPYR